MGEKKKYGYYIGLTSFNEIHMYTSIHNGQ